MDRSVEFLFDTADIGYIRKTWSELEDYLPGTAVKGITTNPNALDKIGCTTFDKMDVVIPKLVDLVTELRDNEPGGSVHIQLPHSNMCLSEKHVFAWMESS